MINFANLWVAGLIALCLIPNTPQASKPQASTKASLDQKIEHLMAENKVVGLGVAVIENGEITHLKGYGYRNRDNKLPLKTDTIMYGASLTKAAFAYMVLQLVDEGLIALDKPLAGYLDKPLPNYNQWQSLEGDEEWRKLTARHILTHTTGLHNLRFLEPGRDLKFHFPPGTAYAYSGEGFKILQFVLEEGLGLDIKKEMQSRLFDRFGMVNTSLQWRADFGHNLADGYAMDGSFEPHDERSTVSASGSMDTTIADQAHLWQAMVQGVGLSPNSRALWTKGQFAIRTLQKFPTIQMSNRLTNKAAPIGLSAGLGVEVWHGAQGPAFAKGGHNDWTGNIVLCLEKTKSCVILLGNSVRAEIVFPQLIAYIFGETGYPWWWTYPNLHAN